MLKDVQDITTKGPTKGLNTNLDILGIEKDQSPNMMNVMVSFDGNQSKRLGSNTQNAIIIANSAIASFSPNVANLTNNLISYWKLDEATGTRVDFYGDNDLSDVGGVSQSGGIKNQAALFIASNSTCLLRDNNSDLQTGDINFSLSSWFYLDSTSLTLQRSIVSKIMLNTETSNMKLLLHCNGVDGTTSFPDNSSQNATVTAVGNAQVDTAQSKFGGASLSLDSSNSYLSIPDSNNWAFGSGDFTIDFQVRFIDINNPFVLMGQRLSASDISFAIRYAQSSGGVLRLNYSPDGTTISNIENLWAPNTATWYHLAFVRSNTSFYMFVEGSQIGSIRALTGNLYDSAENLLIGTFDSSSPVQPFAGWIDEVRILKGEAAWTSDFTAPASAYADYTTLSNYEYNLFVNTDNMVAFKVSSSGLAWDGTVSATSFGALNTATWYNAVAYHDATNNLLAVGVNLSMNSSAYTSGVKGGSAPFVIGCLGATSSGFFDGRVDETSFYKKVLTTSNRVEIYNAGSGNTFIEAFDNKPWASYDFGATGIRWLTVSAGTGVFASSNLGVSWTTIGTDRSATYQYLQRSKNVLVATSDKYDTPLYWAGSAGTFMARLNSNATATKYSINFNGFLILLNSQLRPRGFFYEDENTQLTGTWASSFDIPSTQDDEITSAFILRRYLYVSTKYYLYRVNYVGGNPDFSYIQIKDWGFVPRTVKPLYIDGVGQIVMGMTYDKKLRLFDGSDDKIISNQVEEDNGQCEFALDKISTQGSGLTISFAETDYNENVYKLCVAIGENSMQTTHIINFDGRSQAFYPYSRMLFNTMVMAESGGVRYLMAFDRSGRVHMMDSGNLDGNTTPINDVMDSSLKFEKSPSQTHKGHKNDLFFANNTCGSLYYFDRIDFQNQWNLREKFIISGSDKLFQIHKQIDTPESYNVYQYRITSSSGTNDPWQLNRDDLFTQGMGIGKNN